MSDTADLERTRRANAEQTTLWNEQAGPKWVRRQEELDAQLAPIGRAILERLALRSAERVLDVGCGAGATSLDAAEIVRPGDVVGVDVSEPLLARAAERARGIGNVRFLRADAQTHAFGQPRFDVLVSRFGVMFFDDPVRAFANLREATVPSGRMGFVCWRGADENPLFTLPLASVSHLVPTSSEAPTPDAPGPLAFADASRVRSILEAAGWTQIEIAPHDVDVVYAGTTDLEAAVDLAFEIGPLGRLVATIDPRERAPLRDAVRGAFVPHLTPKGVVLPSATWLVTARHP